jgi:hypothetical protein
MFEKRGQVKKGKEQATENTSFASNVLINL